MGLFMQGVEADASLCDAVKILYGDALHTSGGRGKRGWHPDGMSAFSRMEQPEQVLKEVHPCPEAGRLSGCQRYDRLRRRDHPGGLSA